MILKRLHLYGLAVRLYSGIHKRRWPKALEDRKRRLLALPVKKVLKEKGESLNIVQISTVDSLGGAALVAFRLHKAYKRQGHNPVMFVGDKLSEDKKVISIRDPKDNPFLWGCNKEGLQYWNYLSSFDIPRKAEFEQADILQFHNIHGDYFSYQALPGLTRLKPAVWTLHDMQSVTGHCAFSLDCGKWETGCGECPLLGAYPALEKDTTALLWKDKKEIYARTAVDIVVPSKWLYDIVKKSILAEKDIHLIYNGIDTTVFRPRPKAEMRKKLNIEPGRIVLITSAAGGMKNPQKGGAYLLEALSNMKLEEDVVLVSVGEKDSSHGIKGIKWINTGHIFNEEAIAEWYCAADLFLYPSVADNCPLVILEAMSCGLPVVTFDTGGIPELVRHMDTGYVAKHRDVDDFVKGMETFISDEGLRKSAGKRARAIAEKDFTVDKMADSYLELYYGVIEKTVKGSATIGK